MCAEVGPSPDNLISPRKTAPSGGRARLWPWCGVKCSWPRIWGAVGSPGPRSSLGERESSRRCLPLGPEGPLPATGVGLIFFAFCVTLHPPLSVAKETVTQPRVGPRAQSAWSLLRQWWFNEAALALEPEGGTRGTGGGRADWGGGEGATPTEEAAALLRASWGMLVRVRVSLRAPGDPALAESPVDTTQMVLETTGNSLFPSWVSVGPGTAGL